MSILERMFFFVNCTYVTIFIFIEFPTMDVLSKSYITLYLQETYIYSISINAVILVFSCPISACE